MNFVDKSSVRATRYIVELAVAGQWRRRLGEGFEEKGYSFKRKRLVLCLVFDIVC